MKLFKLTNPKCKGAYSDTFDSAIVCAENADEARIIHPNDDDTWDAYSTWCEYKEVIVEEIGEANQSIKKGVVLASYHGA